MKYYAILDTNVLVSAMLKAGSVPGLVALEAMSGDIIFEPNLQRCINVDIRYVLFIIDKFGGAGYLLNEMDIKQ